MDEVGHNVNFKSELGPGLNLRKSVAHISGCPFLEFVLVIWILATQIRIEVENEDNVSECIKARMREEAV